MKAWQCRCQKSLCIPLGNADGKGPSLYLDGSSNSNAQRDDCSVAWLIPPQKRKQPDDDGGRHKKVKVADHVPTHEVQFQPLIITADDVQLTYQRPVLVDLGLPIPEGAQVCIRILEKWGVAAAPKKAQAAATSFVAR